MPKGCFTDVIPADNARARLQEFAAGLHPLLEDQATWVTLAPSSLFSSLLSFVGAVFHGLLNRFSRCFLGRWTDARFDRVMEQGCIGGLCDDAG